MPPIAYITGSFPNWSETFIAQDLRLMHEAGLPLLLMACRQGEGEPPPGCPEAHFLTAADSTDGAASKPKPVPASWRRRASLWKHRDALDRLLALCREHQVKHVHGAFCDLPGLLAAAAARELPAASYSLSGHARDVLCPKYDDDYLLDDVQFISICNTHAYNALVDRRPDLGPRVHLLPHGIDLEEWPRQHHAFVPHEPMRLLFVGRLVAKKQPLEVIDAVATAKDIGTGLRLRVVGDGPLLAEASDLAKALQIRHEFVGVVPRREVATQMTWADALLLGSGRTPEGDAEGLPNVVLEAMASGLPVIAPSTGSIGEIVDDASGYTWNPAVPDSLLEALLEMLGDSDDVTARTTRARERVAASYDARGINERRLALFQPYR